MKFFKGRGLILRCICLTPCNSSQYSNLDLLCSPATQIPPGFLAIYVGYERKRFLIPTRFLNFPVFTVLLDKASEEYGFKFSGGIVLPCEVQFFTKLLKFLVKDEKKYRSLGFHEFFKLISEVGFDSTSCKEEGDYLNHYHELRPLLQKARAW